MKRSALSLALLVLTSPCFADDKCPRSIVDLSGYAAMVRENLGGVAENPYDVGRARRDEDRARDQSAMDAVWAQLATGAPPSQRFDIPRDAILAFTGRSPGQLSNFVLANKTTELAAQAFFTHDDLNRGLRTPAQRLAIDTFLSANDYGGILVGPLAARWTQARGIPRVARVPALSGTKPIALSFRPSVDSWRLPDETFHQVFLSNATIMANFVDDFAPMAIADLEGFLGVTRTSAAWAEVAATIKEHYLITDLSPTAANLIFYHEMGGKGPFVRAASRPSFRRSVEIELQQALSQTYPVTADWTTDSWTIRPKADDAFREETPLELEERVQAFVRLYRWAPERTMNYFLAVPSEGLRVYHLDEAGAAVETLLVLDRACRLAAPQTHQRLGTGSLIYGQRQGGPVTVRVNAIATPHKAHVLQINGLPTSPNSLRKAFHLVTYATWLLEEPGRILETEERLGKEGEDAVIGNLTGGLRSAAAALGRSPNDSDRWVAETLLVFARSMEASPTNRAALRELLRDFLVRYSVAGRLVPERFQSTP